MKKKLIILNERVSVEDTRFLLSINKSAKELYILHREFPRCLVFVENKTPLNFIVVDFFEMDENKEESIKILTSESFKKDLRDFFISQSFNINELN